MKNLFNFAFLLLFCDIIYGQMDFFPMHVGDYWIYDWKGGGEILPHVGQIVITEQIGIQVFEDTVLYNNKDDWGSFFDKKDTSYFKWTLNGRTGIFEGLRLPNVDKTPDTLLVRVVPEKGVVLRGYATVSPDPQLNKWILLAEDHLWYPFFSDIDAPFFELWDKEFFGADFFGHLFSWLEFTSNSVTQLNRMWPDHEYYVIFVDSSVGTPGNLIRFWTKDIGLVWVDLPFSEISYKDTHLELSEAMVNGRHISPETTLISISTWAYIKANTK